MRLRTTIIAQRILVYYSIRTSLSANVKRLCISSRLVLQRALLVRSLLVRQRRRKVQNDSGKNGNTKGGVEVSGKVIGACGDQVGILCDGGVGDIVDNGLHRGHLEVGRSRECWGSDCC